LFKESEKQREHLMENSNSATNKHRMPGQTIREKTKRNRWQEHILTTKTLKQGCILSRACSDLEKKKKKATYLARRLFINVSFFFLFFL